MVRPLSKYITLVAVASSCRGVQARLPNVASSSGALAGTCGAAGASEVLGSRANSIATKKRPASSSNKMQHLPCATNAAITSRGGGAAAAAAASTQLDVSKSIKWPVFIAFLYYLSIAMTAPALPAFCNQLFAEGGADLVNSRGVNLYGLCTSIDQLFTFLFVGFWGAWSDVIGRKPLVALSSAGVAIGWLTVAFGRTTSLLLAGRALDGVTSCMLPITQSMVQDLSTPQDLGANLGKLQGLAVGGAFITGAMAGGILTQKQGPRFVFKCAATVAVVATLLAVTVLPETLPSLRGKTTSMKSAAGAGAIAQATAVAAAATAGEEGSPSFGNPFSALRLLGRSATSLGATMTFLAFWAGLNGLQINLFNFAQHKFGWSKVDGVKLQATSGILLAISNGLGPAQLAPRIGTRGTVRLGLVLMICCLLLASQTNSPAVFRAAVCGCSLATVCLPVLLATVAGCYEASEGGASMAALETANTLNRVAAYGGMSRVFGWSIRDKQVASGVPAGLFFALGAGAVACGLAVFEAVVLPAQKEAEKKELP